MIPASRISQANEAALAARTMKSGLIAVAIAWMGLGAVVFLFWLFPVGLGIALIALLIGLISRDIYLSFRS